jgi:hypothetical protein
MGKQTAVALTTVDETAFLHFLRSNAEVQLLISSGPTAESLWVESFDSVEGYATFYIWNKTFPWTPEYGTVTADPSGARNGLRYVSNTATAPVIEYSRHNFHEPRGAYGRVYWRKSFAGAPAYDSTLFDKWYSAVVRWLRKTGKQAEKEFLGTYYLPDAWAKYGPSNRAAE